MTDSKTRVSDKVQEQTFNKLLSQPGNLQCADCHNPSPIWVSLDFGVFICLKCSGVHRQLGPHITRVKSSRLDSWTKECLDIITAVGNQIANDYYENKMQKRNIRPDQDSTDEERKEFVNKKYLKKIWTPGEFKEPVEEFISCQKKGIKPNFDYTHFHILKQQEEEQSALEADKKNKDRVIQVKRRPSVSLEEMKSKQGSTKDGEKSKAQEIDLLSSEVDLLDFNQNSNKENGAINTMNTQPQEQIGAGLQKENVQPLSNSGNNFNIMNLYGSGNPNYPTNQNFNQDPKLQLLQQQQQQQNFNQNQFGGFGFHGNPQQNFYMNNQANPYFNQGQMGMAYRNAGFPQQMMSNQNLQFNMGYNQGFNQNMQMNPQMGMNMQQQYGNQRF